MLEEEGIGCIAFAPLAGGRLTDKYLAGVPADSRAGKPHGTLRPEHVTAENIAQTHRLNEIAQERGQSLAQMALAWVLRQSAVTSVLIGASVVSQIEDNVVAPENLEFGADELARIDAAIA